MKLSNSQRENCYVRFHRYYFVTIVQLQYTYKMTDDEQSAYISLPFTANQAINIEITKQK